MSYEQLTEKEKLLIPKYRYKTVTDITPTDIKKMGARGIALDIDNTLLPDGRYKYYVKGLDRWFELFKAEGVPVMIVSNGSIFRVKIIASKLGNIPFIHLAKKPSPRALFKAAKRMDIDINELAMVGDQLTSDVKAANRCGAIAVRVDPIPEKSLYPLFYKNKAKKEKPYLDIFDDMHPYGVY